MASVKKLKKFGVPFGIEILLSHKEVETITETGKVAPALKLPPQAVAAILLVTQGLNAVCAIGGHDGVKIIATIFGPPIPLPR